MSRSSHHVRAAAAAVACLAAGDTGLISNNATAAATSSAHTPTAGTGLASLMLSLGAAALAVIALA